MFIDRGPDRPRMQHGRVDSRYLEVMVNPGKVAAARALKPIHERPVFGRSVMLFENVDRGQLAAFGESAEAQYRGFVCRQDGTARKFGNGRRMSGTRR